MEKFFFLPVSAKERQNDIWEIKPIENTVKVLEEVNGDKLQERFFIQPFSKQRAWRFEVVSNGILLSYCQDLNRQKKYFSSISKP